MRVRERGVKDRACTFSRCYREALKLLPVESNKMFELISDTKKVVFSFEKKNKKQRMTSVVM